MLVAKNCAFNLNNDFELDTIKEIVKKNTFPNIYKLFQVALTIQIIRQHVNDPSHVKNWLRTSMEQDRFSNLAILNIERDMSNNINNYDILEKYNKIKNRRM